MHDNIKNNVSKNRVSVRLKEKVISVRVTTMEYLALKKRARDAGMSLSGFARSSLLSRQLQDEANESFSRFLSEKIIELEKIVKQPSIVKNQYTIDFKSSKAVIAIISLSLSLFCSLFGNYNQYQENSRLIDNDLEYRIVKMKNGILPDEITRLENFFFYPDSAYVVDNIRKRVIDFEHRLQEQTRKLEQKKQNEENIKRLDKEIEALN